MGVEGSSENGCLLENPENTTVEGITFSVRSSEAFEKNTKIMHAIVTTITT